jgi:GrpB-like predicted nucleotidyltransferase (UPF0157 family)
VTFPSRFCRLGQRGAARTSPTACVTLAEPVTSEQPTLRISTAPAETPNAYLHRVAAELVELVAHDPEWSACFEEERLLLERALAPWLAGGVHHIGSTAVPGIAAKPILDLMAGVHDLAEARSAFPTLERNGYRFSPHRPDESQHFVKPSTRFAEATHGLHLTEPGSRLWRERLAFRDALRRDPTLALEYGALKVQLARDHPEDITAYTGAKRAFVARVLAADGIELRPV